MQVARTVCHQPAQEVAERSSAVSTLHLQLLLHLLSRCCSDASRWPSSKRLMPLLLLERMAARREA